MERFPMAPNYGLLAEIIGFGLVGTLVGWLVAWIVGQVFSDALGKKPTLKPLLTYGFPVLGFVAGLVFYFRI
jgi:NhaP-type Na+/H+ or K+/H+ antiporter